MKWIKRIALAIAALLVILIVAGVALFMATSGDKNVADTVITDPSLPKVEIGGVALHAQSFGSRSAPTIIVLHGGPGNDHRSLLGLKELADTHQVVFYDQRGAGLSQRVPPEELTFDAYLTELDGVIAHFAPGQKVVLIGHSWGAMLASAYLKHAPQNVSRAVLMEPGFLNAAEQADWIARAQTYMSGLSFLKAAIWHGFEAQHISEPDADAANDFLIGNMAHLFANHPDNPYHCAGKSYDAPNWRFGASANSAAGNTTPEELDRLDDGADIGGPVLFMAGACNNWIGPDLQADHAKMFANAQLEIIPDAGHELVWEQPEATLAAIRGFLSAN